MMWLVIEQMNGKRILVNIEDAMTVEPAELKRTSTNEKVNGIRISMRNGRAIDTPRTLDQFMATLNEIAQRNRSERQLQTQQLQLPRTMEELREFMLQNAEDDKEREEVETLFKKDQERTEDEREV